MVIKLTVDFCMINKSQPQARGFANLLNNNNLIDGVDITSSYPLQHCARTKMTINDSEYTVHDMMDNLYSFSINDLQVRKSDFAFYVDVNGHGFDMYLTGQVIEGSNDEKLAFLGIDENSPTILTTVWMEV